MPRFEVGSQSYDLPRNILLVDTNVLIALADETDAFHQQTRFVVESGDYHWVVAYPVIVEAWNWLATRRKNKLYERFLLQWLLTPGNAFLILDDQSNLEPAANLTARLEIDLVDALLMQLASRMTVAGSFTPAVHVATLDVRDFFKCFGQPGLNFNLYNMRELTSTAE